jgi:hypothetical protein
MPVLINGRELGVAQNGVFNAINTDPIPGGKLWPEAALTWNAMRAAYIADGGHPDDFMPAGPNSSARSRSFQDYVWDLYLHHGGNPAAPPYSSNHGWAIAVDVRTTAAAAWLLQNASKFGWSHDEGLRVGEWWHFRYVGLSASALKKLARKHIDPWRGYTVSEKRWMREFDKLQRTNEDPHRREVLRRVMREQRKRIWKISQPKSHGGDGKGWTKTRTKRYNSLLSRTR